MSFIWSAVCVNPRGEIILARSFTGEVVITNKTTGTEWRQHVPTDFLRYLCVAATETEECAIGVGGDDLAYVVHRGAAVVYQRAHGQDPVAIIPAPGRGFIPYVFVDPRTYLRGLEPVTVPPYLQAEGTSQGFRQVLPDGTVEFRDGFHGVLIGGHIIARPVTHDGWTVGQEGDGAIGCFEHATGRYFTPLRGRRVVDGIKFAVTPDRRLVLAAAVDPGGEYYDTFAPPYTATGDPPPPPPPPDPEPPMSAPNQIEIVRAALRAHPEIDVLDDHARGGILDLACAGLGGEPWGRKSKNAAGTDLNTDTLTYKFHDGTFEIIDVIAGADPKPSDPDRGKFATWDTDGKRWRAGENGYWVPAKPVSGTPTTPTPPPATAPGASLDAQIAALTARILALEQRPAPQPQPGPSINGLRIALKSTTRDRYLSDWDSAIPSFNREVAHGGETYIVEVKE